jgi:hypothetical protein
MIKPLDFTKPLVSSNCPVQVLSHGDPLDNREFKIVVQFSALGSTLRPWLINKYGTVSPENEQQFRIVRTVTNAKEPLEDKIANILFKHMLAPQPPALIQELIKTVKEY